MNETATQSNASLTRGYLTAAYRHQVYAEQAVCLAISFKYKNDLTPLSIVVDDAINQYLVKKKYVKFFDQVIVLPSDKLYDFIGKLYSAQQTPYDDTIYFDSDCIFIRESDALNAAFSSQDFCVPGANQTDGTYAGIQIKDWLAHNQLTYIPIFNAGVFRFNQNGSQIISRALEIMHHAEKYKLPKADGGLNEQVALGIAMAEKQIHPIPFNEDYHFSFFNANSSLELNIEEGVCSYMKEGIKRHPYIFHYTPLYQAGYFYSRSRKLLMNELNQLRKHFHLPPTEFFKPNLRDLAALIRKGKVFNDKR